MEFSSISNCSNCHPVNRRLFNLTNDITYLNLANSRQMSRPESVFKMVFQEKHAEISMYFGLNKVFII